MGKIIECNHPLIQHKLAILRDVETGAKDFRELVTEISMLMGYEVTADLPLEEREITTPMGPAKVKMISGKKVGLVPILRAGLGMVDGFLSLIPILGGGSPRRDSIHCSCRPSHGGHPHAKPSHCKENHKLWRWCGGSSFGQCVGTTISHHLCPCTDRC